MDTQTHPPVFFFANNWRQTRPRLSAALPAMVTICMAQGMHETIRRHALITVPPGLAGWKYVFLLLPVSSIAAEMTWYIVTARRAQQNLAFQSQTGALRRRLLLCLNLWFFRAGHPPAPAVWF